MSEDGYRVDEVECSIRVVCGRFQSVHLETGKWEVSPAPVYENGIVVAPLQFPEVFHMSEDAATAAPKI